MIIIGRDFEKGKLTEIVESEQPAFVAIYGRRRVGKMPWYVLLYYPFIRSKDKSSTLK